MRIADSESHEPQPALGKMSIARKVLLAMSTNGWLRERATRTAFVRRSVSTFMPGERLEDAMAAAAAQQARGIATIFTKLGENLTRVDEAEEVTGHYLEVLDKIPAAGLRAQISVKPTQLGLDLDKELCFRNLQRLVDRAAERDNLSGSTWRARRTSIRRSICSGARVRGRRASASRCRRICTERHRTSSRWCRSGRRSGS